MPASRVKHHIKKLRPTRGITVPKLMTFAGVFALAGVAMLLSINAAPAVDNAIQPEDGSFSANVRSSTDSNASGGSYVTFLAASTTCPSGQTGTPPNCTIPGGQVTPGGLDNTCNFGPTTNLQVAFCEAFNQPYTGNPSTARTGDLDSRLWGVSRTHNQGNTNNYFQWYPAKGYTGKCFDDQCSAGNLVAGCTIGIAPLDSRVCGGRWIEAVNDNHNDSKTNLSAYPKQPFNWANRTGTVVFDVSLDANGPHGAWPEFWITDQPIPAPGSDTFSTPRNSIGVIFSGANGCNTAPTSVVATRDYNFYTARPGGGDNKACVRAANASVSGGLNHVRITINGQQLRIYMTDPGSTTEQLVTQVDNLGISPSFTQGLIWLGDNHYNACKFDDQCDHAFAWDNVGFDGPKTYRDLSFDYPDAKTPRSDGGMNLGYDLQPNVARDFTITGVYHGNKTPTGAYILFNTYSIGGKNIPTVSLNGGASINTPWPFGNIYNNDGSVYSDIPAYIVHTIAVPIDPNLVRDGSNTIRMSAPNLLVVGNINIVLVDASTVP